MVFTIIATIMIVKAQSFVDHNDGKKDHFNQAQAASTLIYS